jgi:cellulose synthase/poly-beta-1,6-N-acetylglucosamine synthase-like glycosyltransferase
MALSVRYEQNAGLAASHGNLVIFLDADDYPAISTLRQRRRGV